jgi:hypothetical protein
VFKKFLNYLMGDKILFLLFILGIGLGLISLYGFFGYWKKDDENILD